jgi:nucleoside 2-deoxyribosyltransferase
MKVYLAGPYQWKDRIRVYAEEARAAGIEITSTWLEETHKPTIEVHEVPADENAQYAKNDLRDIDEASVLILFAVPATDSPIPRAGRHVEFGYALAKGKAILVVGNERENIFHYLPNIFRCSDWQTAMYYLRAALASL